VVWLSAERVGSPVFRFFSVANFKVEVCQELCLSDLSLVEFFTGCERGEVFVVSIDFDFVDGPAKVVFLFSKCFNDRY
jgi:hypothetical protein